MRRKLILRFATGVSTALLLAAAPTALFAEEYSLDDLFRIALSQSERLKVAEETLGIAELGKEKARSYLLPRMTATTGLTQYTESKRSATGSLIQPETATSWGLRVEESFSLSGRELTALEIARQSVDRSRLDLTTVREDYLLRNVASSYYGVLMARKTREIAEANLTRLTTYRNAAEIRLKIGEVTRTALLRAESELSGARSDQLQARNSLELAFSVLANNCGIKDAFTIKETPAEPVEIPALPLFQQQALASRSDLKGLEIQRKIAADQIRYAEGAFWPNLALAAIYNGADQYPASTNLNREGIYASVSLNFPFFEGGLRKAELAEAKARERQATLVHEDLKKTIEIEVQTAYLELVTQQGILKFLDDQLAFARDNERAVARQFENGLASSLDLIDANTVLGSSEQKQASAFYNYQLALIRMKKATGTLLKSNDL
jgi:outer membrane protein